MIIISQKRKKLIALGLIFFIIMSASGVYAVGNEVSNGNSLSTGAVNIELVEYMKNDNNEEVPYSAPTEKVSPGQEIGLIEKIKNYGAECYVRAKITVDGIELQDVTDFVKEIPEEWQKIGEHYYYKKSLNVDEEVPIFKRVVIPVNLPNEAKGATIKLKVVAEAIQTKNFEPDFSSDNPWDNVEIEQCVDSSYSIDESEDLNKITVEYDGDTQNDITVSDTFFANLAKAMPGDEVVESIRIHNTNKKRARYFMKIEPEGIGEKDQELLKNIQVKITNKHGNIFYEGTLFDIKNGVDLGEYNLDDSDLLDLKLDIPQDMKNTYSMINPGLKWKFYANYDKQDSKGGKKSNGPKTGDFSFSLSLLLFFTSAAGLVIVFILMSVDNKKNRENI
ncbi:MAG: hypothetical protein IKE01_02475 [Clostridia bacterium]|nr:hypothetical protein [Clostridia bacterium]